MNNKWKRITIGFVLPMVIIAVVCVIFYFKNAHQNLLDGMKTVEVSTVSKVAISERNWEEYFTLETNLELVKNEEGKQPRKRMRYQITDAAADEWEITGALIGDEVKYDNVYTSWAWGTVNEGEFETVYEHDNGVYMGQEFLEVPEDITVEAVVGELYFDEK